MPVERRKRSRSGQMERVSFKTSSGKRISFKAKMKKNKVKYNFPKNPKKGELKTIRNLKRKRKITFRATGYSGQKFGQPKWIIISNKPL